MVADISKTTMETIRRSPIVGISFDTKKRDLSITIHYVHAVGDTFDFISVPFCRVKVAGENAKGLSWAITRALADNGINLQRLAAIGADGAGVNGVMSVDELKVDQCSLSSERNVCKNIAKEIGASLLCHHCCGHKLQLVAASGWHSIAYLRELESRVRSLHKQLERSGKSQSQLIFWTSVCNDEVVTDLRYARARWISQLGPMEHLHKNYISFLAYMLGQYETLSANKKDEQAKNTISWIFSFFCTWECRVTIAGCVDLLRIMMAFKCKLERT